MGDPHEKNPNSVNITLKKMTMKICLGRRDMVGRGDLWGIGEWGIGEKWRNTRDFITEYLIRMKNSRKLLQCCFFWYDSNSFPISRSSNFRDVSTWL